MRLLQNILLVFGTASVGLVTSFWGVALVISLLQSPGGEPWTRGFGQFIGGMVLAPAGGIIGVLAALGWMRARGEHHPWRPKTWLGIVLGCAGGYLAMVAWAERGGMDFWFAVIPAVAASGFIGGIAASAIKVDRPHSLPARNQNSKSSRSN